MLDLIIIIDENKVIDVVLIVGWILFEVGVEIYWIEDIMNCIVYSYGLYDIYSFVILIVIIFLLNDCISMRLICICECIIDFEKIVLINSLFCKILSK